MKIRTFLFAALLAILTFSAIRMWQEQSFGTGPADSTSPLTSESLEVAFVANAVGGTVSLVDLRTRRVIDEIDVTPDGKTVGLLRDPVQYFAQPMVEARGGKNYAQDTDLSRDGRVLFVSRGFLADVVAIDLKNKDILWRIPIAGLRSDHMDITPDGKKLFVSAVIRGGDIVEVLDTATGEKLGQFQAGDWPHDVHVSKDGKRAYAASLGDMETGVGDRNPDGNAYRITEVDADSLAIVREYRFDAGIRPFQIAEKQGRLFAQLSNTHAIVARDLAEDKPVGRIDLPIKEGVTEDDWDFEAPHHGLALSPDEKDLCVAGRASDYAAFVDAENLSLKAVVNVGNAPSWSVFSQDGSLCLVANTRSDDVSFVSLEGKSEVARVAVGRGPKHITIGRIPIDLIDK